MLAAEFHYDRFYCDRFLDLDDIIVHIEYHRKNPPMGGLALSLLKRFFGDDEENEDVSSFTEEVVDNLEGMNMEQKFEYLSKLPLTEQQKKCSSRSFEDFKTAFTGAGGEDKT